jgi:hypothetical protein
LTAAGDVPPTAGRLHRQHFFDGCAALHDACAGIFGCEGSSSFVSIL